MQAVGSRATLGMQGSPRMAYKRQGCRNQKNASRGAPGRDVSAPLSWVPACPALPLALQGINFCWHALTRYLYGRVYTCVCTSPSVMACKYTCRHACWMHTCRAARTCGPRISSDSAAPWSSSSKPSAIACSSPLCMLRLLLRKLPCCPRALCVYVCVCMCVFTCAPCSHEAPQSTAHRARA